MTRRTMSTPQSGQGSPDRREAPEWVLEAAPREEKRFEGAAAAGKALRERGGCESRVEGLWAEAAQDRVRRLEQEHSAELPRVAEAKLPPLVEVERRAFEAIDGCVGRRPGGGA